MSNLHFSEQWERALLQSGNKLSLPAKAVGCARARYSNWQTGECWRVTTERLARELGVSRDTVTEHTRTLAEAGWLELTEPGGMPGRGRFPAAQYRLTVPGILRAEDPPHGESSPGPCRESSPGPCRESSAHTEETKEESDRYSGSAAVPDGEDDSKPQTPGWHSWYRASSGIWWSEDVTCLSDERPTPRYNAEFPGQYVWLSDEEHAIARVQGLSFGG